MPVKKLCTAKHRTFSTDDYIALEIQQIRTGKWILDRSCPVAGSVLVRYHLISQKTENLLCISCKSLSRFALVLSLSLSISPVRARSLHLNYLSIVMCWRFECCNKHCVQNLTAINISSLCSTLSNTETPSTHTQINCALRQERIYSRKLYIAWPTNGASMVL